MSSMFPDTPATLLARIAVEATGHATDEASWTRLFGLYAPAIRAFAEHMGTPSADSEDVVQEIFAKLVDALRAGGYSTEAGRFRCYLATTIRHALISRWRKAQVRVTCVPIDRVSKDELPALSSETESLLDAKWLLARHEAAVDHALTKTALSQQSREIYRAYVLEGRPIGEVASRFNVPRNTVARVKTRVSRMIAAIEAEYDE